MKNKDQWSKEVNNRKEAYVQEYEWIEVKKKKMNAVFCKNILRTKDY